MSKLTFPIVRSALHAATCQSSFCEDTDGKGDHSKLHHARARRVIRDGEDFATVLHESICPDEQHSKGCRALDIHVAKCQAWLDKRLG